MKTRSAMKQTASSQEYAKVRKRHLEHSGEIRCGRCPYHRGENRNKPSRSWKDHRPTQYKEVLV